MGVIKTVGVHVDNCRDMANKVGTVTFKAGPCLEKLTVVKLADVESRSGYFLNFLTFCSIWFFLETSMTLYKGRELSAAALLASL